jgi:hypothetical protein
MKDLQELSREELITLVKVYAANWLAHDGCWFLAAEEKYGIGPAIELDTMSWKRFARAEASRIIKSFDIPPGGGLDSLEKALGYRMYSVINPQEITRPDERTLRFSMLGCRVQDTRAKKGLPDFPCKPVGEVEFSTFASTVDPGIRTRCVHCPPDEAAHGSCAWEFTMESA